MPLPFDGSVMPAAPLDIQRPGPVHISTLSSALASASPENQRVVCYSSCLFIYDFLRNIV